LLHGSSVGFGELVASCGAAIIDGFVAARRAAPLERCLAQELDNLISDSY
jgi:hypothetical protein